MNSAAFSDIQAESTSEHTTCPNNNHHDATMLKDTQNKLNALNALNKLNTNETKKENQEQTIENNATSIITTTNVTNTTPSNNTTKTVEIRCNTSTLFVGGLHRNLTDAHLYKLFQPYGSVQRVYQVLHKPQPSSSSSSSSSSSLHERNKWTGQPKGYAFVEMDTLSSARLAIQHLDGRMLLKRRLIVRPAHSKTQPPLTSSATSTSTSTSNHDADNHNADNNRNQQQHYENEYQRKKEQSSIEHKIQRVKMAIEAKENKKQKLSSHE